MPTQKTTAFSLIDNLKKREDVLRILMFSLVTVFVWIGFSIYLSQQKTKVPLDVQKHLQTLNPNIDRTVFPELSQRKKYSPEELNNFDIYQLNSGEDGNYSIDSIFKPTQTAPVIQSSPSAQPEITPPAEEATEGAEVTQ